MTCLVKGFNRARQLHREEHVPASAIPGCECCSPSDRGSRRNGDLGIDHARALGVATAAHHRRAKLHGVGVRCGQCGGELRRAADVELPRAIPAFLEACTRLAAEAAGRGDAEAALAFMARAARSRRPRRTAGVWIEAARRERSSPNRLEILLVELADLVGRLSGEPPEVEGQVGPDTRLVAFAHAELVAASDGEEICNRPGIPVWRA